MTLVSFGCVDRTASAASFAKRGTTHFALIHGLCVERG
ncbi:hypothetical protein SGPA1_21154 [Streptomyces misionensis JCM 4497]